MTTDRTIPEQTPAPAPAPRRQTFDEAHADLLNYLEQLNMAQRVLLSQPFFWCEEPAYIPMAHVMGPAETHGETSGAGQQA